MTKAEYNRRLQLLQQELAVKCGEEDIRHNQQVGAYRSEFRQHVKDLQAEFSAEADSAILRDRTTLRPA